MNREDVYARCPFYSTTTTTRIVCEGLTKYSNIHHEFKRGKDRKEWKDWYCCDMYEKCKIYQMLQEVK